MTSGKTTFLLDLHQRLTAQGWNVKVWTSARDTRPGQVGLLKTHDGRTLTAEAVGDVQAILDHTWGPNDVVFVDEIQMFPATKVQAMVIEMQRRRVPLVVAGLDTDYQRKSWGWLQLELFDSIHRLKAPCSAPQCTHPAAWTMRVGTSSERIVVGGADDYRPVCTRHHPYAWSVKHGRHEVCANAS
jgi:thymidine kinase